MPKARLPKQALQWKPGRRRRKQGRLWRRWQSGITRGMGEAFGMIEKNADWELEGVERHNLIYYIISNKSNTESSLIKKNVCLQPSK